MDIRNEYKRGTTGVAYGLVVGLIGIVALAAITTSGSSINALFDETATTLGDVVAEVPAIEPPAPGGPDAFDFADTGGAEASSQTESAEISLSGSFSAESVSISGGSNSRFRINGGPWVTTGTVNPGDTLQLTTDASPTTNGTQTVTVSVGSVSDQWIVTTRGSCSGGRCIFLTSTTHNGNLGGAGGADTICQARAAAGGLSGTFFAYLSEGFNGNSAAGRFTWNAPYYNLSGGLVSQSAWPYVNGWESNGITNEFGVMQNTVLEFWSNTASSGNHCGNGNAATNSNNNCQEFVSSNSGFDGITGLYSTNRVTHLCQYWRTCANAYPLLCVEE